MSIFRKFASFFRGKSRKQYPKRRLFSRKQIEYKIKLLDNTYANFYLEASALGCDLLNQVFIQLDLVERDYFSLMFTDKNMTYSWIDPVKKLVKQTKNMQHPYEFVFCVKFYAIDPDQLNEELTRYHFFLQLKEDIEVKKIVLDEQMAVELAALAIQSELGDYDPEIHQADYMKEALFISNQAEDFMPKVEVKHRDLVGLTPGECEINFLKRIKYNDYYGIERHIVYGEDVMVFNLGFAPKGVVIIKEGQKTGFHPWNRINMIAFKKKNIRLIVHNRFDPNILDKYNYTTKSSKTAKLIWKSAIEHHSFFRLIKVVNNFSTRKSYSSVFTSNYRYSGRTFYEASEETSKLSRRKNSLKRAKTTSCSQRSRVGYIRIGSRVFAKAENGEYFKGIVVALSDKVYVKCDDGVTLAHQKNTTDGILYDSSPDPCEVLIGTRVIAHWPGISNFLPGNVNSIDGSGNFARYLVAFDDGDTHWNNIDQIRLLKPPMYFGPGSNTTYLQKKFSMLKTTTLVNAKIAAANNYQRENTSNNVTSSINKDSTGKNIENDLENNENSILTRHPRTTSSNDKIPNNGGINTLQIPMLTSKL